MLARRIARGGVAAAGATVLLAMPAVAAAAPKVVSIKTAQSGNTVTVTVKTKGFAIDANDVGKKGSPDVSVGHRPGSGGQ
jgi:hypothetical protein